jgi:hypothetical protein
MSLRIQDGEGGRPLYMKEVLVFLNNLRDDL